MEIVGGALCILLYYCLGLTRYRKFSVFLLLLLVGVNLYSFKQEVTPQEGENISLFEKLGDNAINKLCDWMCSRYTVFVRGRSSLLGLDSTCMTVMNSVGLPYRVMGKYAMKPFLFMFLRFSGHDFLEPPTSTCSSSNK